MSGGASGPSGFELRSAQVSFRHADVTLVQIRPVLDFSLRRRGEWVWDRQA